MPTETLLQLASGFHVARALYVAAKLGVADLLVDGPKSGPELAAATGTHAESLERILRLLACVGVFSQDDERRFGLTSVSMALRSNAPVSFRDLVVFQLGEEAYRAWGEVLHGVRTGSTAFNRAFGADVWEYRARDPEYGALFDSAMSSVAGVHVDAVLAAYPFSELRRVVDLGGGVGAFLIALLSAHPEMQGILFDLPHVAEAARAQIANAGLAHRCAVQGGDLLDAVPQGADAYILSRVVHDWDDAQAKVILENCRRAMPPSGRVLLLERVVPGTAVKSEATRSLLVSDLTMMVMNGGRERTADQYQALLAASGLRLVRIVPTVSGISLIEAQPRQD